MKTCQSCGELNGDKRTTCYKCKAGIGAAADYRKVCTRCGAVYAATAETCETCGTRLSVQSYSSSGSAPRTASGMEPWMFAVSVLLPFIGLLMGLIYIARGEDDVGKTLLISSLVAGIIWVFLAITIAGCTVVRY